jgi:hypothetical protein
MECFRENHNLLWVIVVYSIMSINEKISVRQRRYTSPSNVASVTTNIGLRESTSFRKRRVDLLNTIEEIGKLDTIEEIDKCQ